MLTVNGELVEDAVVREEAAALRPKYYEVIGAGDPIELEMQLREWSRENVIERVLLQQEAARRGIDVEALLKAEQGSAAKPKPKEISELYAKDRDAFWAPERIHVAHIVKNIDDAHPEEEAARVLESALADLARGEAFGVVADRYSDCAGNGGDLGWFPRGQMVEQFDAVVFGLAVGGVSGVFRTPFGLHIAQVKGRRPEGHAPLAEVREHIEEQLMRNRQQQAIEAFLDRLRAAAVVTL